VSALDLIRIYCAYRLKVLSRGPGLMFDIYQGVTAPGWRGFGGKPPVSLCTSPGLLLSQGKNLTRLQGNCHTLGGQSPCVLVKVVSVLSQVVLLVSRRGGPNPHGWAGK
jgi:hypothetical protein